MIPKSVQRFSDKIMRSEETKGTIMPAGRASVEFRSVIKQYGAVRAVNDIDFTIEPGTLVTLLGPSGCGKTTTLRLIAGLEIATAGQILIGGEDVTLRSAAERDVSMVFQSYALFPHMSVFENVAYGPTVQGMAKQKIRDLVHEKLGLVGLAGLEQRAPSELSGGQQQRVAVARALIMEPQVLLFDEPLSNLDAKLRRRVREEIRELQLELKLTVAYVTHDQEEALAVSDRIIVMHDGRIAQAGTPVELYEQPASLFVADFIGDANLVDAELTEERGERALIRLGELDLDLARRGVRKGPVKLAVRAEGVTLHAARPSGPALAGRVSKASYLGKHLEYTVDTAHGALFVVDHVQAQPIAAGSEAWITFGERGTIVMAGEGAPGAR
jgi:iron(III) transport system ATP-binding protein